MAVIYVLDQNEKRSTCTLELSSDVQMMNFTILLSIPKALYPHGELMMHMVIVLICFLSIHHCIHSFGSTQDHSVSYEHVESRFILLILSTMTKMFLLSDERGQIPFFFF